MLRKTILIGFLTLFFAPIFFAQEGVESSEVQDSKIPRKVDEFGMIGNCDLNARVSNLFIELNNSPSVRGYIIVYYGKDNLPSTVESGAMEKRIRNEIMFLRLDAGRITIINGGFRENLHTEIFIVPDGADVPEPTETIPSPSEPSDKAFLYDRDFLDSEYQDFSSKFILPSVLAKIDEENRIAEEEETKTEQSDTNESTKNQVEEEITETEQRTPEEIEAEKFYWLNERFGERIKKLKDSSGVMIFYADDQYYDIGNMQNRIEEGKQKLAAENKISPDKIQIIYGGFREQVQLELWIVPRKAKLPTSTPEERPIPEAEN